MFLSLILQLWSSSAEQLLSGISLFDIAAGTGDMNEELMDLFSNAYEINQSTQYEEFIGWYIGANPAYPGNDTNPYCMGWESNWLGLQVWGYVMDINCLLSMKRQKRFLSSLRLRG